MPRTLLIAGTVVLVGTALFHMTGLSWAASWLEGDRGLIVALLWGTAAFNSAVVASVWLFAALRPSPVLRWPVLLTALIPAATGALLLGAVDIRHPGGYLLLLASALAVVGARRLR